MGYMPNFGYPDVRDKLAAEVSREQGTARDRRLPGHHLRARPARSTRSSGPFSNPADEVMTPAPFFVEYGFYCENHGAKLVTVPAKPLTFQLDLEAYGQGHHRQDPRGHAQLAQQPVGRGLRQRRPWRPWPPSSKSTTKAVSAPSTSWPTSPTDSWPSTAWTCPAYCPSTRTPWSARPSPRTCPWPVERIGYALVNPAMEEQGHPDRCRDPDQPHPRVRQRPRPWPRNSWPTPWASGRGHLHLRPPPQGHGRSPGRRGLRIHHAQRRVLLLPQSARRRRRQILRRAPGKRKSWPCPAPDSATPASSACPYSVEDKIIPRSKQGFAAALAKFK